MTKRTRGFKDSRVHVIGINDKTRSRIFTNLATVPGLYPGHGSRFVFNDDIHRLEQFLLKKPKHVLFFTDNSGEVFFDIPLFHFLGNQTGHAVLVVKGGPSLNDLTRIEIKNEQLEPFFSSIADTGTEGVGIDWDLTSSAFRNLVEAADLIVSKGMANFETVYPKMLSSHVFFLLKSKCSPIQDYLGTSSAGFCAIWKEGRR